MAAKTLTWEMAAKHWLGVLPMFVLGLISLVSRADDGAANRPYREVRLHLLDVDGKPAAHRVVHLRGWSEFAVGTWGPMDESAPPGWRFITDAHGDLTAKVGYFKPVNRFDAGYGVYALVIDPGPNDAGGVSQRFSTGFTTPFRDLAEWAPEWGEWINVLPAGLDLTLSLQPGITVQGRVVEDGHPDRPLAGVQVTTWNNLNIGTRTGEGGKIFGGRAMTDRDGHFVIRHQYPKQLFVTVNPGLWLKTKMGDGWKEPDDLILPPSRGTTVNLDMAVQLHPAFHYVGTVTDLQNRPIANMEVLAVVPSRPLHWDWDDGHRSETCTTGADGTYDLAATSPWVMAIMAERGPQQARQDGWEHALPPGRYNLHFKEPLSPDPAPPR
jgi:hypothetical protein